MYQHCTPCHHEGGGAPFPFTTYEEVKKRARLIAHVTGTGYMPPWKAAPGVIAFEGERHLDPEDAAKLAAWAQAGSPLGDVSKVPPAPVFESDWPLGKPDLILEMEEDMPVPAEGPDIYRGFVVRIPDLPEGKYLKGLDYQPQAIESAHHTLFSLDTTGIARARSDAQPRPGFGGMSDNLSLGRIGGWAVGGRPHLYPEGVAIAIKPGTDLILATHFHPGGKAEIERARIGIYLTDEPPTKHLVALDVPFAFGLLSNIRIPAGEAEYLIEESFTLPADAELISISPHAHYIGKRMRATIAFPDGREIELIRVDDWDFAWQEQYRLAEPLALPQGARIDMTFVYDNSAENPRNPTQPPVEVTFGPESTDEMACMTLGLITESEAVMQDLRMGYIAWVKERIDDADLSIIIGAAREQRRDRIDLNGDGSITFAELRGTIGGVWQRIQSGDPNDMRRHIGPYIVRHGFRTLVLPWLAPALLMGILLIAALVLLRRRWRRAGTEPEPPVSPAPGIS